MRLIDADALHYYEAEYCPTGLWLSRFDIENAPSIKASLKDAVWTPVKVQLPPFKTDVLACFDDGGILIADCYELNNKVWWEEPMEARNITGIVAWMPLPEPYKEVKRNAGPIPLD